VALCLCSAVFVQCCVCAALCLCGAVFVWRCVCVALCLCGAVFVRRCVCVALCLCSAGAVPSEAGLWCLCSPFFVKVVFLVGETHGTSGQCVSFSLIDAGSVFLRSFSFLC